MATQRAKAHHIMVCYEKNIKNALRTSDPLAQRFYLFCAVAAHQQYSVQWKKKKQPRGQYLVGYVR